MGNMLSPKEVSSLFGKTNDQSDDLYEVGIDEDNNNMVRVRWFDGYLEVFEVTEVRFRNTYLWIRLTNGQNRHIPLTQVRWFSLSKESPSEKSV